MEPFDLDQFAVLVSRLEGVADTIQRAATTMAEAAGSNASTAPTLKDAAEMNLHAANLMGAAAQQMVNARPGYY